MSTLELMDELTDRVRGCSGPKLGARMLTNKFKKIIVWGYPLYSHTHSFIHYGWFKAFSSLGHETYWFHDKDYPADFDYRGALFITEGFADENIPLEPSATYAVHVCKDPAKYLNCGAKLLDVRFNLKKTKDFTYDYTLDHSKTIAIDEVTRYEEKTSDAVLVDRYRTGVSGYSALYMVWATDMLPHEINLDDALIARDRVVHHVGSRWSANGNELYQFQKALEKVGIGFVVHDPWQKVTSNEEAKALVQRSYIAPDIRGAGPTCSGSTAEECNHLTNGYIPCRVFKNISYGHLGVTNSQAVKNLMQDYVVYSDDVDLLLQEATPYLKDTCKIQEAMKYVQAYHTYYNRIDCLLKVLE